MNIYSRIISASLTIGLAVFVGYLVPVVVLAEEITHFSVDIQINENTSVSITEEITYDFEGESRHGIYREIPISYSTNTGNRRIFVDDISVQQDEETAQTSLSRQSGNLRIRIGNPDVTITGQHTYTVYYNVRNALNFFDDGTAELYWDIVGTGWEVPIRNVTADIQLPEEVDKDQAVYRCFMGATGSTTTCPTLDFSSSTLTAALNEFSDLNPDPVTNNVISPGDQLTVVLNFPDDVISPVGWVTKAWWYLQANPLLPLPLIAFILSFYIWFRWGKDPKGRGVVVTQYEPPEGLKPILVGAFIDETVHMRDITAGIIYLAEQGFIQIEREDKKWILGSHDYIIREVQPIEDIPDETYKHLAQLLFSVGGPLSVFSFQGDDSEHRDEIRLSKLKKSESFAKAVSELKKDVMENMRDRGWFAPQHNMALLSLVMIIILIFGLLFLLGSQLTGISIFSAFTAFGITILFMILMEKKTKEGAILQEKLEGFELFLSMTQKERLDFHNAPEREPGEFMEYLPYAVALGVEKKWAAQFTGLDIPPPSWYHGTGAFVATSFASDLTSFSESYSQAASGSSGTSGGEAGGGMGGGGGGSW